MSIRGFSWNLNIRKLMRRIPILNVRRRKDCIFKSCTMWQDRYTAVVHKYRKIHFIISPSSSFTKESAPISRYTTMKNTSLDTAPTTLLNSHTKILTGFILLRPNHFSFPVTVMSAP